MRRTTRSQGLPPTNLPPATPSGYKVDLPHMYQRLVDTYYTNDDLKWRIEWGHNMTANSAVTCFRNRVIKVSMYIYKKLYEQDDSENNSAYKLD